MRRLSLRSLILLLACAALSACGGGSEDDNRFKLQLSSGSSSLLLNPS